MPSDRPGLRQPISAGFLHGERDAEVGDDRPAALEQNVFRLDVAMDDAALVRVRRARRPLRVAMRTASATGSWRSRSRRCAKTLAFDERHDVEQLTGRDAGVEQRKNARMLQLRRRPNLGQESLGADDRGEFSAEHLERDLSFVADVLREIHGRHPARAHLALDDVPTDKLGTQRGRDG